MTLRVVLADDMPLARHRLRRLLAGEPDVTIVGEAGDGLTAVDLIQRAKPDVAFLDIHMPELDGFGVVEAIDQTDLPAVVFVTAFDEFAVRAFDVQAVDYLLKPLTGDRLHRTLTRVRQRLSGASLSSVPQSNRPYTQRFIVRVNGRTLIIPAADVHCIRAEGNYVRVSVGARSWLMREPLSSVAARLDPAVFARIHRSSIVSIAHVTTVAPVVNGDQLVTLSTGATLTMSRTYRRAFVEAVTGEVRTQRGSAGTGPGCR